MPTLIYLANYIEAHPDEKRPYDICDAVLKKIIEVDNKRILQNFAKVSGRDSKELQALAAVLEKRLDLDNKADKTDVRLAVKYLWSENYEAVKNLLNNVNKIDSFKEKLIQEFKEKNIIIKEVTIKNILTFILLDESYIENGVNVTYSDVKSQLTAPELNFARTSQELRKNFAGNSHSLSIIYFLNGE